MHSSHEQIWRQVSQEISRAQGNARAVTLQPAKTPLSELGLDSLKLIEIVYELETFYQLDVDEEHLAELHKVSDLIDMFASALTAADDSLASGEHHDPSR